MRKEIVASWGLVLASAHGAAAQKPPADLQVQLKFTTQESVRANSLALPASVIDKGVEIDVEDARQLSDPLVMGSGTDDDDRKFAVRATTEIRLFVAAAVGEMATAQTLKRATPGDRALRLRITRFQVSETNRAVGSTYLAEVHFAYTLKDGQGQVLNEGAAAGTASRYGRARSGANCSEVLSDALKDALTKTLADPLLQQAWSSGEPRPTTRPAVFSPGRASAASVEERLKTLDDLLTRGVITKEEHATRRAAILKEL